MEEVDIDPFTQAIRSFFVSQLGAVTAQDGVSLNFDPLPPSLSNSEFSGPDQAINAALAEQYFSMNIADRSGHISGQLHYSHMSSLSGMFSAKVVESAVFYPRTDLAEHLNEINNKLFDKLIASARAQMDPVAATSSIPFAYIRSMADPSKWYDPTVTDIWRIFNKTFVTNKPPPDDPEDPKKPQKEWVPSFFFRWRHFDWLDIKKLIENLKGPKPNGTYLMPYACPYRCTRR